MENNRVKLLYERFVHGAASESEIRELLSLLTNPDNEHLATEWLDGEWHSVGNEGSGSIAQRKAILRARILGNVRHRRRRRLLWQWGSAAALVLTAMTVGYLLSGKVDAPPVTYELGSAMVTEVDPGGDKAVLILADGKKVALDHAADEPSIEGNGLKVTKSGTGEVTIAASHRDNASGKDTSAASYHTIRTPVGGQYRVILPDGTKVMLNASSALKFPASFPDDSRTVEFSGEGYFDVHHDEHRPFLVITDCGAQRQTLKVLGTGFNIYAYQQEGYIATTVEAGRVSVANRDAGEATVEPGQQLRLSIANGQRPSLEIKEIDLYNVLAWRDGLFVFNDERLSDMLNRVARWYDVEFVYQDDVGSIRFQGNYLRNKGMLNLLSLLEVTGNVKFRFDGNDMETREKRRVYVSKT